MNKLALKKRWLSFHNIDEILKATENLKISPFGETPEGLVDFRGIPLFTTPIETGGGWVNKSQKTDIYKSDFSYSEWKGFDIKESTIKDCIFNAVKFVGNIYFYSNDINNCIFTGCSFKDVHFTKSKIIKTIFEKITHKDRFSFDALKIDSLGGRRSAIRRSCVPLPKGIPCGRSGSSRRRMTGQYRTSDSRVSTLMRKPAYTTTASVTTTRMWEVRQPGSDWATGWR